MTEKYNWRNNDQNISKYDKNYKQTVPRSSISPEHGNIKKTIPNHSIIKSLRKSWKQIRIKILIVTTYEETKIIMKTDFSLETMQTTRQ